jgi:glycolate oxidase
MQVQEITDEHSAFVAGCGHAGDGNVHLSVFQKDPAVRHDLIRDIFSAGMALGGAISGEHGIGLAKTPFLRLQHNPAQVRAMQAVKKALDPRGILNPGKMFGVVRIWKYPKLKVHLPWDHK